MSNLGMYQTVSEIMKKMGGPKKAIPIILAGASIIGHALFSWFDSIANGIRKNEAPKIDTILKETSFPGGPSLKTGSKFYVMFEDGDAIQIAVIDDKNSPYFVPKALLQKVSTYKP